LAASPKKSTASASSETEPSLQAAGEFDAEHRCS
jgi:hypothetical protein